MMKLEVTEAPSNALNELCALLLCCCVNLVGAHPHELYSEQVGYRQQYSRTGYQCARYMLLHKFTLEE